MTSPFQEPVFGASAEERLLAAFRRAASDVPAYQTLLAEGGVRSEDVHDLRTFSSACPLLSRVNTFDRFSLSQLSVGGELRDVAEVLTSSGHGGRFSFGVTSRAEATSSASFIDNAMDEAFAVKSKKTLAINCLPMGVVLSSQCMTVATTSVREDMAVALVNRFGDGYEQIVLIGDPLFMKRLTDHALEQGVNWGRHRVSAVIGEETFGPHFRRYLEACLGVDPERPGDGHIMSSFGVAELGLHLCFETVVTNALARAAAADAALALDLFGGDRRPGAWRPMLLTFNPQRTFIEIVDADRDGYGRLTISMLDPSRQVPLLRYQTGDMARLLDREQVAASLRHHGVAPGEIPLALLALRGRDRESLPNGSQVGFYKDALYANPELARHLTGAVRLIFSANRFSMHVQLVRGQAPDAALDRSILQQMPSGAPSRLVLWRYAEFPFGMTLDYERKFSYHVLGEPDC